MTRRKKERSMDKQEREVGQGHTIRELLNWRKQICSKRHINLEHLPLHHGLETPRRHIE